MYTHKYKYAHVYMYTWLTLQLCGGGEEGDGWPANGVSPAGGGDW